MRYLGCLVSVGVFVVMLLSASPAVAATIFADNFNGNSPGNLGLNVTPLTWNIAPGTGTVDTLFDFGVIGGGACTSAGGSPSGGVCIDLDGTSSLAGRLQHNVTFASAGTFELDFWLRGNGRGGPVDVVDFGITGLFSGSISKSSADPWAQVSTVFTVAAPGTFTLFFDNQGGDNFGAWLDDVLVQSQETGTVPEPMSLLLLSTGLVACFILKRRT
jgi:hypothetical protein